MTASAVTNASIAAELTRARARTLALVDDLDEADQRAQHSPLMSPLVWDLAHIGNYEDLWLRRELDGSPGDAELDDLYNAFEHPRWARPSLPILGPAEARAYDTSVRERVLALLAEADLGAAPTDRRGRLLRHGFVYGMVLQHEHQHDETMLATRQLMGERAPAVPGASLESTRPPSEVGASPESDEVPLDLGTVVIGTDDDPWAYDNERGACEVELAPFAIDRHPVTNRQWLAFVEDGGYQTESVWGTTGWVWCHEEQLRAPLFWRPEGDGAWSVLRFGRRLDLVDLLDEPVQHVCWHEADAFARWAGRRLPTEAEWEAAARWDPLAGRARRYPWGDAIPTADHANLGQRRDGPDPIGTHPSGVSPTGVHGLIGDVWEWTSSSFTAYPGFEAFPYREYSEVFWGDEHKVLRGGSWAADHLAVRGTFRNWDLPIRRQIFCGLRTARDG